MDKRETSWPTLALAVVLVALLRRSTNRDENRPPRLGTTGSAELEDTRRGDDPPRSRFRNALTGAAIGGLGVVSLGVVRLWYSRAYGAIGTTADELGTSNYEMAVRAVLWLLILLSIAAPPAIIAFGFVRLLQRLRVPRLIAWMVSMPLLAVLVSATWDVMVYPVESSRLVLDLLVPFADEVAEVVESLFMAVGVGLFYLAESWIVVPLIVTLLAYVAWRWRQALVREFLVYLLVATAAMLLTASWLVLLSSDSYFSSDYFNDRVAPRRYGIQESIGILLIDPPQADVCVRWLADPPRGFDPDDGYTYLGGSGDYYLMLRYDAQYVTRMPVGALVLEPNESVGDSDTRTCRAE